MMKKTCIVTGGLGYIGSHICLELLSDNYNVIILDNLSNSKIEKLDIIKKYSSNSSNLFFYLVDLANWTDLKKCFEDIQLKFSSQIDIIIHLAGLKAVSESIDNPTLYYDNNLSSTLNILKLMEMANITNLIFSSSATVYGNSPVPYTEQSITGNGITNPYGRSKYLQEEILKDIAVTHKNWNIVLLRYFNPVSHINPDFKEDPNGIPNNLFPYLLKVHSGQLDTLTIFGNDYNTRDGTCTRDFIHVCDLANAHAVCSNKMIGENIGLKIYNVGTGTDTSVLELITLFEKVNQTKLNWKFGPKRSGDLVKSYSNVDLITNELGWKSKFNIVDCVNCTN